MKAVTQAFKDAIGNPSTEKAQIVSYKRRYWSPASKTYIWEADWTVLPQSQVEKIGAIVGKLDTETMNEFKISNVTLSIKNDRHQWAKDNPAGYFGPDAASPLYGYIPYWTKFKIQTGVKLASGTMEYMDDFVGVALDPIEGTDSPVVQMTVQGLEALLINANAEDVSTLVTAEVIGTGNNSDVEFTTANAGVGIIEEVAIGGIAQAASLYDISQLNELSLGAKITFKTAPASGSITCTYRYWKQDQVIKDLVEDLLTAAGVTGASQQVAPVLFPNAITNVFTQDTQADWLAGTLSGLDASSSPGDIIPDASALFALLDDFDRGDTSPPGNGWYGFGASVDTNRLALRRAINVDPMAYRGEFFYSGAWQVTAQLSSTASDYYLDVVFGGNVVGVYSGSLMHYAPNDGYFVRVTPTTISLCRAESRSVSVLASSAQSVGTTAHTIKITRNHDGLMTVIFDSTAIISVTDTTFTNANGFYLVGVYLSESSFPVIYVDDVYTPPLTANVGTHVSDWLDAIAPVAWGRLIPTQDANGAAITYETQASADKSALDDYVPVASNGQALSAVKRYLRVKATLSNPPANTLTPAIHRYSLQYQNIATVISLANFTGKTVYQAIQELGGFANYEFGFMGGETFYFRAKDVTPEVQIELAYNKNMSGITDFKNGYDKVYSEVQATYGTKTATVKDTKDYPESPGAQVGARRFEVDGGDLLIPEDTDIATGVATLFFAYLSVARKTFKAKCKLLSHVELSDVARVTFTDNTPRRPFYMGDTSVVMGDQSMECFGSAQQIADGMLCKVVGYRHDPDACTSEIELEEIIQ